jgi:glutathione S-transferase
MERHLEGHGFFIGERYSVADIALCAYTHVEDEGGFDLGAWMEWVATQPEYISIALDPESG